MTQALFTLVPPRALRSAAVLLLYLRGSLPFTRIYGSLGKIFVNALTFFSPVDSRFKSTAAVTHIYAILFN